MLYAKICPKARRYTARSKVLLLIFFHCRNKFNPLPVLLVLGSFKRAIGHVKIRIRRNVKLLIVVLKISV